MKNILRSKTAIAVIVVIILIVGYFYWKGSSPAGSGSLLQAQSGTQGIGSAELDLLDQVQSLKIDASLFQDPAYKTLQDYSVAIPTENVGRPNPFAPYAGEAVTAAAAQAASGH